MRNTLALFVSALCFTQAAAQSTDARAEEVKETLVAMWAAIEQGDLESYGSYIHPDFTAFGEYDVYLASGKELEMRNVASSLQTSRNVHTEMHQPEVTIVGNVAWIVYYWTDSGMANGEPFSSRGKSTRIFVHESGQWLCIHGHYTAVP